MTFSQIMNSPLMYILAMLGIGYVLLFSVFTLMRSYRHALAVGLDKKKVRAVFGGSFYLHRGGPVQPGRRAGHSLVLVPPFGGGASQMDHQNLWLQVAEQFCYGGFTADLDGFFAALAEAVWLMGGMKHGKKLL